ncbi:MAG: PD-(D/E)XK nuclease family protein [Chloroflexota bacterium]
MTIATEQKLPDDFVFSQSSLGSWERCRRLFLYRHIEGRAYPAPETADMLDFEQYRQRGERFHQSVHQYLSGVDPDRIAARLPDEQLQRWWGAFQAGALVGVPEKRYAETTLTATVAGYRLLAKYDLIAVDPAEKRIVIMDWKTTTREPNAAFMAKDVQTAVYRYLAVEAGAYYLDWSPVVPEQVEMVYWYPNFPGQAVRLPYDTAQHASDGARLTRLIEAASGATNYPRVDETQKDRVCRFCVYRNLCWDDVTAGPLAELEGAEETAAADFDFDIGLDQVGEIEF